MDSIDRPFMVLNVINHSIHARIRNLIILNIIFRRVTLEIILHKAEDWEKQILI